MKMTVAVVVVFKRVLKCVADLFGDLVAFSLKPFYLSEQISHGDLQLKVQAPELQEIRDQLRKQQKQRYWLAVGATSIVTGTLILTWGFLPALAWTLIAAGVLATFAGRPRYR